MEKVQINKPKNEVLVHFNEVFYQREFIDQAIMDFKQACDVERTEEGILMKPKEDLDVDVLGYEFYNYVLGLIKNR